DRDSGEVLRLELPWPARYLCVPEAVEGECGFEFVLLAAENESVSCEGRTERSSSEFPALENFGVPDGDLRSRGSLYRDAHPSDEILAEVHERLPGWRRRDLLHWKLVPPHGAGADVWRE